MAIQLNEARQIEATISSESADRTMKAIDRIFGLINRAQSVADRLLGTEPQPLKKDESAKIAQCFAAHLQRSGEALENICADLQSAVDRLERFV